MTPSTNISRLRRLSRSITFTLVFIGVFLLSCVYSFAQDKSPQRGVNQGGAYAISDVETINTTNGNVMLHIPLGALPSGRGGLSASVGLMYNSKLYDSQPVGIKCPAVPPPGHLAPEEPAFPECSGDSLNKEFLGYNDVVAGWHYTFGYKITGDGRSTPGYYDGHCNDSHSAADVATFKLQVLFPDGSRHDFRPYLPGRTLNDGSDPNYFPIDPTGHVFPNSACNGWSDVPNKMVYYSVDGTYMRIEFDNTNPDGISRWTLYMQNDMRVTGDLSSPNERIYDKNNNYIDIQNQTTYNGHTATKLVDQLGRSLIIEYGSDTDQDSVHVWGYNNQELVTKIKWKTVRVNKSYSTGAGGLGLVLIPALRVVDTITLPLPAGQTQNLLYTFGYNASNTNPSYGWGEISSVTMPSGAQTSYTYHLDGVTGSGTYAPTVLMNYVTGKDLTYQREYDGTSTPVTEHWSYNIGGGASTITGPDGGVTTETFNPVDPPPWNTGLVYKIENPDGSVIEKNWQNNIPYGTTFQQSSNTYVKTEFHSIKNAAGQLYKTAVTDYQYDENGNLLQTRQSDWVDYSTVHSSGTPIWTLSGVTFAKTVVNQYWTPTPDATQSADDANLYIKDTSPHYRGAVKSAEVQSPSGTLSRTEFFYDDPTTTANLTQQKTWSSGMGGHSSPLSSSNSISVTTTYDSYGNPVTQTDPLGIQTHLTYDASAASRTCIRREKSRRMAHRSAGRRTRSTISLAVCRRA